MVILFVIAILVVACAACVAVASRRHKRRARGRVKLVGTAQRVVRHGSLLAASVAVSDGPGLRAVLAGVYAALELDWDEATAGAVEDEVGAVALDDVERAVLAAYGARHELVAGALDPATLAAAHRLESWHRITGA